MKDLRLGINLVDLDPLYKGGINTFALGLIQNLKLKNKVIIFSTINNYKFIKENTKNKNYEFVIVKNKGFVVKFIRLFSIILKNSLLYKISVDIEYFGIKNIINSKCNVFYCPLTHLRPLNLKIQTVTSIHDIQHLNLPENFNFFEKNYRNLLHSSTIKYSKKIQVSSIFIKKNLIKFYFKNVKDKIIVIPEGVSKNFRCPKC